MRRSSATPRTSHQELPSSRVFQAVALVTRLIEIFSYVPQIPHRRTGGIRVCREIVRLLHHARRADTGQRGANGRPFHGAWLIAPVRVRILEKPATAQSIRLLESCPHGDRAQCGSTPAAALKHNPVDEENQDFPQLRKPGSSRVCMGLRYAGCGSDVTRLPGPIIGHGLGQRTGQ